MVLTPHRRIAVSAGARESWSPQAGRLSRSPPTVLLIGSLAGSCGGSPSSPREPGTEMSRRKSGMEVADPVLSVTVYW